MRHELAFMTQSSCYDNSAQRRCCDAQPTRQRSVGCGVTRLSTSCPHVFRSGEYAHPYFHCRLALWIVALVVLGFHSGPWLCNRHRSVDIQITELRGICFAIPDTHNLAQRTHGIRQFSSRTALDKICERYDLVWFNRDREVQCDVA